MVPTHCFVRVFGNLKLKLYCEDRGAFMLQVKKWANQIFSKDLSYYFMACESMSEKERKSYVERFITILHCMCGVFEVA